ncbi:MAG TPA: NF038122 family metalloprotease [Phycisphaerae bacterium]|nr:NF038122 family metalloprotease [Phycisphaerae bacterium]
MKRSALLVVIGMLGLGVVAAVVADDRAGRVELVNPEGIRPGALVYVEQGPAVRGTVHVDGSEAELPSQTVIRPMCGSDTQNITPADLVRWRAAQLDAFSGKYPITVLDTPRPRGVGANFIFNLSGNVPPSAATALTAVEAYLENQWVDPVTISINVDFASMGGGVLGATGSDYVSVGYSTARTALINGQDPDDTLQDFLPVGVTIPVRYDGNTGVVTNEGTVFVTEGNYNAAIGNVGGVHASMTYNSDFNFDFDPSNGITGGFYCFQSVAVHEVGHAMGFTSGADFRTSDIEMLDLYRFQNTDGGGDFNPDDTSEFGVTARLVDFNVPDNDVNSDLIVIEYPMSDGNPNQASHFREQALNIGIMDPTFASGVTFSPNFYKSADRAMFDAIGWDNTASPPDVSPPEPDPMTFEAPPAAAGTTSISMTATSALDDTPPIQYMFQCTSATPGGTSSFWQVGVGYTDTGLQANTPYSYRIAARDNVGTPNQTAFSPDVNVSTAIETPQSLATGVVGVDFIELVALGTFTNLTEGQSGLYFDSLTPGGDTGLNVWVQGTMATATGLLPDTDYEFVVKARNRDGVETALCAPVSIHTFWVAGDCNNDLEFTVESDLDCIVEVLLNNDASPPPEAHRIDLNYNEITDGEDIQFIIDCLQFGGC